MNVGAQSLLDYFESRHRIHHEGHSAINPLIGAYLLRESPKACDLRTAVDGPAAIAPHVVSTFVVDMRDSESLCNNAPTPARCEAIRGSCVAVETAIFCDVALDAVMGLIAEATYDDLYLWVLSREQQRSDTQELRNERRFFPAGRATPSLSIPPLLTQRSFLAAIEYGQEIETMSHDPNQNKIARDAAFMAECHASLMTELPLLLGTYGPLIAHEYSHVEQYACPDNALSPPSDADSDIATYRRIACSTARRDELLADLRAVEITGHIVEKMLFDIALHSDFKLHRCRIERLPISDDLEERILWRLRGEFYTAFAIGLLVGSEYRSIVRWDPVSAVELLKKEPEIQELPAYKSATLQYYHDLSLARERQRPSEDLLGHMSEPYRIGLTLSKESQVLIARTFPREWHRNDDGFFATGYRMEGVLLGQLEGLHQRACKAGQAESKAMASRIHDEMFPSLAIPPL